ncbi:hypothetical protein [Halobaculum sp. MBLA0143]|uniref:hypothetical protein n=1 Tax=Halobaculum sp. MBLA0143 TaxID=3079933 RepID=UPI003524246E
MRRRQPFTRVVARGVVGVSGCAAFGADGPATLRVRDWRDPSTRAGLSVTPETPGTRECRDPETTAAGETVTITPEELVEVTTIRPGAYAAVLPGGGHGATRCLRHEGESAYTFVADEQVMSVPESTSADPADRPADRSVDSRPEAAGPPFDSLTGSPAR